MRALATVLRYAYVPEVTGVRLSMSQVASRIASWICPLNVLLHVSEICSLSVCMRLGFGSQPDISSWLQSYPAGVAKRPRAIPFSIHFRIVVRVQIIARVTPSWWSSATATAATSIVLTATRVWSAGMSPECWSRGWKG
jgi:hypothetical protein